MKTLIQKYATPLLIIIALIVISFLFKDWLRPKIITALGGYVNKEVKTDTITKYKIGKIDTLEVFNNYVKTKGIILNPKPKIEYVREVKYDTIRDTVYKDLINTPLKKYNVAFKDTLIDGNMTIRNRYNGDLYDAIFDYKVLDYKLLQRVDTVFTTVNNTTILDNKRGKIGTGIGFDNRQFLSISGSYTFKNDIQIIGTYGKSLQETQSIINGQPFNLNNGDYFGIILMKNW